jgi:hypothetical protein
MRSAARAAFAVLSLLLFTPLISADTVRFDPTGSGNPGTAVPVAGFQEVGGTAAQFGTIPFGVSSSADGVTIFQGTVGSFVNSVGNPVTPSGMNSSFSLLLDARFIEHTVVTGNTANFTFSPTSGLVFGPNNQVTLFFHPNTSQNPDTGAGFHAAGDGNIALLTGHIVPNPGVGNPTGITGSFTVNSLNPAGNLDQFEAVNHGPPTLQGNGSQQIFIKIDTQNFNYFLDPLTFVNFSTATTLPFNQGIALDPTSGPELGATFFDGTGAANVGATNGLSGPDIELQSAPNAQFFVTASPPGVPEPSTLLLASVALAGWGVRRWTRRGTAKA